MLDCVLVPPLPQDWALYPPQFLIQLQNIFLGLISSGSPEPLREEEKVALVSGGEESDEDVDGVPLDGAAMLKAAGGGGTAKRGGDSSDGDSLDGAPLGEPEKRKTTAPAKASGFVASKWETIDPEEVRKGAVTTSKWEQEETKELVNARRALMGSVASKWDDKDEDLDGAPLDQDSDSGELPELDTRVTEQRRQLLRDLEVRMMQYQDEVESGRKTLKAGWTVSEQVEHHRKKMMRKALEEQETPRRGRSASESPSPKRGKKKKRRRTQSSSRSRSPSPVKKKEKRRRSSSSSPERNSRRGRDRSRSKTPKRSKRSERSRSRTPSKKHKKKSRH